MPNRAGPPIVVEVCHVEGKKGASATELAEVVRALRDELGRAIVAGTGEALRFELGPVELELSVAIEAGASAEIKPRFVVVSLGANGSVARTSTQRIKLTLTPHEGPASTTPMIVGRPEAGER